MWCRGGQFNKDDVRIDDKVVIITGANAGIGKETAIDLGRRGGKVYLACRDITRGENALKEIKEKSGSENIHLLQLNLASMSSIREFSKKFHDLESELHILINNAGVMAIPKSFTEDGFEMQFGTNHLGHFLLTNLLLDLLKSSAPSRIVNISSLMHKFGQIKRDDVMNEQSYSRWLNYANSKLANILFTRELVKRLEGTGVTANSVHPGVVNTDLSKDVGCLTK
jgi:NAD(P)-dependent dehydrogenase (short-subunit alcohol dehydrogenase family)